MLAGDCAAIELACRAAGSVQEKIIVKFALDYAPDRLPTRRNFCGGSGAGGQLTCSLPGPDSEDRDLLLVNENAYEIPRRLKAEFDRFAKAFAAPTGQRIAKQKSLANAVLRADPRIRKDLPHVGVAVHKLGPVPVFLIPDATYETSWNGRKIEVRVAVHPLNQQSGAITAFSPGTATRELIDSLAGNLGRIMTRYFGDVAILFEEIEHTADHLLAARHCREIRRAIGESIKTKLDILLPRQSNRSQREDDKGVISYLEEFGPDHTRAREVYQANWMSVTLAGYVATIASYLVSKTYQHLGFIDRNADEKADFAALKTGVEDRHGPGAFDEFLHHHSDCVLLKAVLDKYLQGQEIRDDDLVSARTDWSRQLAQYIRFLSVLANWSTAGNVPRIFFSRPHHGRSTSVAEDHIYRWLVSGAGHTSTEQLAHVITAEQAGEGSNIRSAITAGIWQSDAMFCIFPSDYSDYRWIVREAEYARLLRKRLYFFIEDAVDTGKIRLVLKPEVRIDAPEDDEVVAVAEDKQLGCLVPSARTPAGRARRLLQSFDEKPYIRFRSGADMDPQVESALQRIWPEIRNARLTCLLLGYLHHFTARELRALAVIEDVAPWPDSLRKAALSKSLAEAQPDRFDITLAHHAITSLWEKSQRWYVDVKAGAALHQAMSIVQMPQHNRYSGCFERLLAKLKPEQSADEIRDWRCNLLEKAELETAL